MRFLTLLNLATANAIESKRLMNKNVTISFTKSFNHWIASFL